MEKMYSTKEAAEYLGVCEGTIRKWVLTKTINYNKVNGYILRFSQSDLDAKTKRIENVKES